MYFRYHANSIVTEVIFLDYHIYPKGIKNIQ
jgi:hypothetical protein